MKKLPHKFKIPLIMLIMMPTMLMGLPAIMTYRTMPQGADFVELWLNNVWQTVPPALLMVIMVGSITRFVVSNFLVQKPGVE